MQDNKKNIAENSKYVMEVLFKEAEQKGGLEYIYTILRVTGITKRKDPLIELEEILKANESPQDKIVSENKYPLFDCIEESLCIICNLLSCSAGEAYKHCFFRSLYTGTFPNIKKPTIEQMLNKVRQHSAEKNHPEIVGFLDQKSFDTLLGRDTECPQDCEVAKHFLQSFIAIYKDERLKFKNRHRFYKLPRFEVLELIVDETNGLCGFRLYFSNGSSAEFIRKEDSTNSLNISLDRNSEVTAFVGDLDALTEEWRVGQKRLYEIGLPGRYNEFGKWKPLIYPKRKSKITSSFLKETYSLSDDEQVQGVLFYIMCTAHQVIEFVVKADIDLPWKDTTLGKVMHLHKCPETEKVQNYRIYDGTYYLHSCKPEEVEMGIATINLTLNTIAFAYNLTMEWKLKYGIIHPHESFAKIEEKDLKFITSILDKYPRNTDGIILNSAIDWYIRGVASKDVFAGFLCYYRVIEMISTYIYKGKASFNLGFRKTTKAEDRQKSIECIEEKYNELYEKDKFRFVTTAYSDCIQGTRYKTEQVLNLIFGEGHKFIKDLFESPESTTELSLYEIRSKIVHGNLTLLDKNQVKLVQNRLWDIQSIAKELIIRLTCSLKPSEGLPTWSGMRGMAMGGDDPRTYLITNNENMFPKSADWTIKPEWCA